MKTLPALAAVAIALALVMTPMMAHAAGSISFTSPASGASYSGSQSYSIAGTVSPVPTQADNVGITVKNPTGQTVDVGNVAVSLTTGAFTYATAVGGTSSWTSGTYTITATDSLGATGTTTFSYTATSATTGYNQTRALINIQGNLTIIQNEIKALQASEATEQTDMKANFSALSSAISSLTSTVSGISTAVSGISNQVTSLTSSVGTLTTDVNNLTPLVQQAASDASGASSAVSSTQTYVLVVAVLAAITLVLELAILVRKIS